MDADSWVAVAAIAQVATVVVAGWALIYAHGQVQAARDTAERVAQPDVVVFIERDPHNWHYMDLVVKNFGQTTAYNLRITLPPLAVVPWKRADTGEEVTSLYVPQTIAVLAPQQEWRTSWDSGIEREEYKGELQSHFVGHVEFDDKMNPDRPSYRNPISLDADMLRDSMHVTTEKSRTVEKALYEISGTLKGYKSQHGGMWVYTVPGDDERQYYAAVAERRRANREHIGRMLRGESEEPRSTEGNSAGTEEESGSSEE
ncbi:hypothetical protein [Mycolicibacterium rhodesiae]|uniref:Uncharacterized protein n=1 Tax=Mycolicibacterium rhodesiae TaxID=36814 RepID=A0A1X0IRQ2_MYCRH|nr:hypothetical protein [Mycolicibacterium rhodesiae]MCV7343800.1 hypothetical protein [Mycolicibacterium rhodesiae]ORB51272.1 hypothetical protein BST42_17790 [Mycolicibacterium rhodesiae]